MSSTTPQTPSNPPIPTSAASAAAINDLLASLSDTGRAFHASLSTSTAVEVERLREVQRLTINKLIGHISLLDQPRDVISTLQNLFVSSKPSFFLDFSYRFVASNGLTFICDWFEAAFDAHLRDANPANAPPPTPLSSLITIDLTTDLLLNLLRSWYRISVYQIDRSRAGLPPRSRLLSMLRILADHPHPDISDLARGLLAIYFPDALLTLSLPPSSTSADGQPIVVGPPSLTSLIRAEFELLKQQLEAHQRMRQEQERVAVVQMQQHMQHQMQMYAEAQLAGMTGHGMASPSFPPNAFPLATSLPNPSVVYPSPVPFIDTNGTHHPSSTPSPTFSPTLVKREGESVAKSSPPLPLPSSAPSAIPITSPVLLPSSPPSPPPNTISVSLCSLSCPICNEQFNSDLGTYQHCITSHSLHLCVLCALTFNSEQELYAHFESHNVLQETKDALYACGLCGLSFHTEDGLTLHHSIHTMERKPLQIIQKKGGRKRKAAVDADDSPSKSKKKKKDEDEEEGGEEGEEGGTGWQNRFPPAICAHSSHISPLYFASDEDLQSHLLAAHSLVQCFANDCEMQFPSVEALADHIVKVHVKEGGLAGGAPPPHCHFCGLIWTKRLARTEHLHRHEKPFHCPICGMRFARRTRWRNHVKRKHDKELPGDKLLIL